MSKLGIFPVAPFLQVTITDKQAFSNGSGKLTSCFSVDAVGPQKVCIFILPIFAIEEFISIRLFRHEVSQILYSQNDLF